MTVMAISNNMTKSSGNSNRAITLMVIRYNHVGCGVGKIDGLGLKIPRSESGKGAPRQQAQFPAEIQVGTHQYDGLQPSLQILGHLGPRSHVGQEDWPR